jgi:hypothetical protein
LILGPTEEQSMGTEKQPITVEVHRSHYVARIHNRQKFVKYTCRGREIRSMAGGGERVYSVCIGSDDSNSSDSINITTP